MTSNRMLFLPHEILLPEKTRRKLGYLRKSHFRKYHFPMLMRHTKPGYFVMVNKLDAEKDKSTLFTNVPVNHFAGKR